MADLEIGVPQIEIVGKECDGHTGIHTISLRVIEKIDEGTQVTGPVRQYGVTGEVLASTYANSFKAFIEAQREEMMRIYAGFKVQQTQPDVEVGHRI